MFPNSSLGFFWRWSAGPARPRAPPVVSRDYLWLPSIAVLPASFRALMFPTPPSRLAPVCQPPPRPHYAASPNDHIPLSQLAEASSGDRSLRSPVRTEFCQVNLAPKTPRQSCQWLGGERAHGKRRQQAQGSVLGGKQRPCWKGAGLFMCFKHNSSTKPPSDKRLAI